MDAAIDDTMDDDEAMARALELSMQDTVPLLPNARPPSGPTPSAPAPNPTPPATSSQSPGSVTNPPVQTAGAAAAANVCSSPSALVQLTFSIHL
jgi:hypothetical protein